MEHITGDEDRVREEMFRIPGFVIRRYRPGDQDEARRILAGGLTGLAGPAFRSAIRAPSNLGLLLAASGAVHALTASPVCTATAFLALLALVYLACRGPFTGYVREILNGDMADIARHYLSALGGCFWVAEEEEEEEGGAATGGRGGGRLAGIVAAKAEPADMPTACHLYRLSVDPRCRGRGLARGLIQVVLDFARDGGFCLCALDTTSVQQPALRLYQRMGFQLVGTEPVSLGFLSRLSQIDVCHLEKRMELAPALPADPRETPAPGAPHDDQVDGGDSNPEEKLESAA
ncbi:N-acetyltransferase 8B-like [Mustelus asterias]